MNPLRLLRSWTLRARSALRVEAWLVEGRELAGGETLRFVYAGIERHKNYWLRAACAPGASERRLGRFWTVSAGRDIPAAAPDCPLFLYELSADQRPLFRGRAQLWSPLWMSCPIDLESEAYRRSLRNGSLSEMKRKCAKFGYEPRLTRDLAALRDFYETMYRPYVRAAHGDAAYFDPFESMADKLKRGELLLVQQQGRPIAGILLHYEKTWGQVANLGVLAGCESLVPHGLNGALMYHALERMKQLGLRRSNLGFSRGFLKDGALRWKMRMGAQLGRHHRESGWLGFQIAAWTPGVRRALEENPMVVDRAGEYRCAMFVPDARGLDESSLKSLMKDRHCLGASGLEIYSAENCTPRLLPLPAPWAGQAVVHPACELAPETRVEAPRDMRIAAPA